MSRIWILLIAALAGAGSAVAEPKSYPPLSAYLMPQDQEVALARTAAPANISGAATVAVLTPSGYQPVSRGTNGFLCVVMRGFTAPTYTPVMFRDLVYDASVRAPICFNPLPVKEVWPYYELRTALGMKGKSPDQIQAGVEEAYRSGKLPKRSAVSFGYMWSGEQNLGPMVHHWHPHVMVFSPNLDNAMFGDNPFGQPVPQVTDDANTPFSVAVIPVGDDSFVGGTHEASRAGHTH